VISKHTTRCKAERDEGRDTTNVYGQESAVAGISTNEDAVGAAESMPEIGSTAAAAG
jgi:hypothetical protein